MVSNEEVLEIYLRKVIEFCGSYDAFSIPAAMMSGGTEIRLQDVYTYLPVVEMEREERSKDVLDEIHKDILDSESITERLTKLIQTEVTELNWEWYLSAPGGGKTTLLKMIGLSHAYRYYVELFGENNRKFENRDAIEEICGLLKVDKNEGACPFFISVRELDEQDYPDVASSSGFKKVIADIINNMIKEEELDFDLEDFLKSVKRKIYIADSVEEFSSYDFRKNFLTGLDVFSSGSKCYLSSRYREYMENANGIIKREGSRVRLSGRKYVIRELGNHTVRAFAKKWYTALNNISGRKKLDVDRDFLIPVYKNVNVENLISNPLELASLLMISSYDSYLPSNYAQIYGRSIELWLSWGNISRYNYEDVMRQLSQVAYQMAASENDKIIVSLENLKKYILQSRKELKRYFQQEWPEDEKSIDEFISYICHSHLMSRSTDGFDFVHRQYQAYLVAYCISTNNFSREMRRRNKFDYIEEHIREKDDFWNQIYMIIAIIDIELRDDIITTLFELSEEEKDSTSGIYYVARLIEIAIIPGVNFDENERKQLIELLIQDENKWRLFSSKEKDLCELLNLNDQHGNEAFIKVAIRRTEELSGEREKEFKDKIATLAFYCIWHCKVGEPYIKEALPVFFDDFINVSMIRMILDSKKLTEQQIYVKKTVCTISQDAIETSGSVDCSMLAAAILGYQDAPYSCADKMISRKKSGSDIIAICILEIGSWLLRYKIASDLRYDIEEAKWAKYQKFILNGILDNISYEARIKYLDVFGNLSALGVIKKHEVSWFRKDVFETVLRTALAEYGRTGEILEPSNGEINSCFRHLALYPGCFSKYCKNIIEEMNLDPTGLIEKIKAVQDHPVKLISKKVAAQLLFIMSDLK